MGDCVYCGKKAGLFKTEHEDCKKRYETGKDEIINTITEGISSPIIIDDLKTKLNQIAANSFYDEKKLKEFVILGWEVAVDKSLDDQFLSAEEEERLETIINAFELKQDELNQNGSFTKFIQSAVLREIMEGKTPHRMKITGANLPFNFEQDESLIWLFGSVPYLEGKVHRRYEGLHHGVSMRVATGLYYRIGAFKGQPVATAESVQVDEGLFAVTNKHLYFKGKSSAFRVKYEDIISFTPLSDGLGFHRESASTKHHILRTGDGWFVYNLVTNLAKKQS